MNQASRWRAADLAVAPAVSAVASAALPAVGYRMYAHLVVPAASGVQFAADAADQLTEPALIGGVDVLVALLDLLGTEYCGSEDASSKQTPAEHAEDAVKVLPLHPGCLAGMSSHHCCRAPTSKPPERHSSATFDNPSAMVCASSASSTPALASALAYAWLPCKMAHHMPSTLNCKYHHGVIVHNRAASLQSASFVWQRSLNTAHPDVFLPHALVKGQRLVELLHQRVCLASEAAAPQLLCAGRITLSARLAHAPTASKHAGQALQRD